MAPFKLSEYHVPAPLPMLRFAVVADLHNRDGEAVADAILLAGVDAVLVVGDLFEAPPRKRRLAWEEAKKFLYKLRRLPVFYSRGNHDYTLTDEIRTFLDENKITLLDDTYVLFRGLMLGGLCSAQYKKGKKPNTAFLEEFAKEGEFKVLLCHHPEYYRKHIRHLPIHLTIAGHAHGGQWRIGRQGLFSPGQGPLPRYTGGLYDGRRLLVSRGLKISRPIPRIGNPRELMLLSVGDVYEK